MKPAHLSLTSLLARLVLCVLWACGSSQAPARPSTQPSSLASALEAMCAETNRLMSARDRRASQRLGALNLTMMDSDHRPALEEMGRGMATEPHPIAGEVWRFEDMREQAGVAGEANFHCPSLERLLDMVQRGDEDFDEDDAATFAVDFRRSCEVVEYLESLRLGSQERRARFSEYVVVTATNPEFFQMFGTVAAAAPDAQREVIQRFAAEHGVENWTCLADFVGGLSR